MAKPGLNQLGKNAVNHGGRRRSVSTRYRPVTSADAHSQKASVHHQAHRTEFTTDHWNRPLDVCGGRQSRRTDFRSSASAFRSLGCAAIDFPAGELSGSQLPTLPASVSVRRFLLVRRRNTMLVYGSTLPSVGETLNPQRPHLFTLTWSYTIATVPNCLIPAHCPAYPVS